MTAGNDKREAIFQATLKMVAENGFHGASVAKVAKEAGVSAGIMYHYFQNKDDMLVELYWYCKRKLISTARKALDSSIPLEQQVRNICAGMVKSNFTNPYEVQYIQQFVASPYNGKELMEEVYREYADVMEVIQQAKDEKIVKDLPGSLCASLMIDYVGCVRQRSQRGEFELTPEVEVLLVEMIWDALKY